MGNAIYRLASVPNSGHQEWASYPQSPVLTLDFPYQSVCVTYFSLFHNYYTRLLVSENKLWCSGTVLWSRAPSKAYTLTDGAWVLDDEETDPEQTLSITNLYSIEEANNDIFTDEEYTTVYFSKTTSGGENAFQRVRNIRNKDTSFIRSKAMRHKSTSWKRVNL